MKQNIYLLIVCFFLLTACSEPYFKNRPIHSNNFINTINSYMKESNDGSVFEVTSQSEEISDLKNNSSILYLGKINDKLQPSECKQEQNNFYCRILLSMVKKDSLFSIEEINKVRSFFDLYFLYNMMEYIGDSEGLEKIKKVFMKLENPGKADQVEYYYFLILDYKINNTVADMKDKIENNISSFTEQDLLDLDYNKPILLHASIILSNLYDLEVNLDHLKDIYEKKENQITILFRDEITYWVHLMIAKELEQHFENKKFMTNILSETRPFHTYFYSLESIRNLYLMSNVFASKEISDVDKYLNVLSHRIDSFSQELKNNKDQSYYQYSYYLNYAEEVIGKSSRNQEAAENTNCRDIKLFNEMYYCYKATGEMATSEAVAIEESDDLLTKVLKYDIIDPTPKDIEEMKKLYPEVLNNESKDFYIILNIYTSLVQKHNLDIDKELIRKKVEQYECYLGYCEPRGNYVFELSVYLNNILNILEGDEFAQKFR
ncbi:hypothetical protein [Aeribacillus pallidus]|uniref:Lipoprotein n=1 Tax=Aeribacillus pallidus TaxID=33936 RepID=A0A223E7W6_9BACI|nr:hypothetical protein [Aeribacillus pallidus]ASS91357.1 hypothetical protein AP3564_15030 [Aeribacillus pallidus]